MIWCSASPAVFCLFTFACCFLLLWLFLLSQTLLHLFTASVLTLTVIVLQRPTSLLSSSTTGRWTTSTCRDWAGCCPTWRRHSKVSLTSNRKLHLHQFSEETQQPGVFRTSGRRNFFCCFSDLKQFQATLVVQENYSLWMNCPFNSSHSGELCSLISTCPSMTSLSLMSILNKRPLFSYRSEINSHHGLLCRLQSVWFDLFFFVCAEK